jgi:hypothetical protein
MMELITKNPLTALTLPCPIRNRSCHADLMKAIATALRLGIGSHAKWTSDDDTLVHLVDFLEAILPDEEGLELAFGSKKCTLSGISSKNNNGRGIPGHRQLM